MEKNTNTNKIMLERINRAGRNAMTELCGEDMIDDDSKDNKKKRMEIVMEAYHSGIPEKKDLAKSAMLYQLSGFIGYMIKRYYSSYIPTYYQDLYDEAVAAVLENMEKYDPSSKFEPTTYFTYHIKHALTTYIAEKITKTTRYRASVIKEIKKAQEQLAQMGIENPSALEIATLIDRTVNVVQITLNEMKAINTYEYDGEENLDFLQSNTDSPEKVFKKQMLDDAISDIINDLDPVQKAIIEMHYGFTVPKQMSYAQIAAALKMQKSDVKLIHDKLMRNLRNSKEVKNKLNLSPEFGDYRISKFSVNIGNTEETEQMYDEIVAEAELEESEAQDEEGKNVVVEVELICDDDECLDFNKMNEIISDVEVEELTEDDLL